jgi:hypothetical protein
VPSVPAFLTLPFKNLLTGFSGVTHKGTTVLRKSTQSLLLVVYQRLSQHLPLEKPPNLVTLITTPAKCKRVRKREVGGSGDRWSKLWVLSPEVVAFLEGSAVFSDETKGGEAICQMAARVGGNRPYLHGPQRAVQESV